LFSFGKLLFDSSAAFSCQEQFSNNRNAFESFEINIFRGDLIKSGGCREEEVL